MRIIFIGPPGAGKGTQAQRLIDAQKLVHLSTGDMLRQAQQENSELGKLASSYMSSGQLVPDDIVLQLVGNRLAQPDCRAGCLLDGFPRTLGQARALDDFLARHAMPVDVVIELRVSQDELLRRLSARGRADDSADVVRKRLTTYEEQTRPLLDYYQSKGLLQSIDAVGAPEEVFQRILRVIDRCRT